MSRTLDAQSILAGLKDFQRATVEHAYHRLFEADDSSRRFLVADEVGLGKTMVARGIVAKAIERLRNDGVERIDVVYICSNSDIAAQNVRKLDVTGSGAAIASRLTLLAAQIRDLEESDLNLVALTPGTSFNLKSAMGRVEERVLLHAMLEQVWAPLPKGQGSKNLLQGGVVDWRSFRQRILYFDRESISPGIAESFAAALEERAREDRAAGVTTIRERFEELCEAFAQMQKRKTMSAAEYEAQRDLIAELRGILAAACVEALEPDLIVLDEFQRFKHLLEDDGSSEASLARSLFNWQKPGTNEHARLLLLSATPYRALTVAADGGEDDHYEDFLATVRFLLDNDERCEELRELLSEYRRELYGADPGRSPRLREISAEIEAILSKAIARTERVGAAGQHDAMLRSSVRISPPRPNDIREYLMVQDIAQELDQPDVTELWKSAPYLMNFLDGYQLRARFDSALKRKSEARRIARVLRQNEDLLLDEEKIEAYARIDPGGARLRELTKDVLDSEAWRLLWIPPSMPYHQLAGAYAKPELRGLTKRLIFSSWRAVPRAVAGILSYLAERALTLEADPNARNTPDRRTAQRNRLQFARDQRGRLRGMPVLALLYPSPTLADAANPHVFAAAKPDGTVDELLDWARERVSALTERLPAGSADPPSDERWYWAAPILLDQDGHSAWWEDPDLAWRWAAEGTEARDAPALSRWAEHVDLARSAAQGALERPLGTHPDDLVDVLARLAVGGPGTLALRSIARVTGADHGDPVARLAAGRVAWGLRALFNSPEATALLRAFRTDSYWQEVLKHAIDGDLQAVLDEHAHILFEAEGLRDKPVDEAVKVIADAMTRALSVRASRVNYTSLSVNRESIEKSAKRLHTAFAARFGEDEGGVITDGERPPRASQLRDAFNSPYWPFVLASTSVGQEGLDFHPYCHVVVHWNLPTNPVDLEQREGRVHRYKNHAVRKNVAAKHRAGALASPSDPWATAFELAAAERLPADCELVPYWIYPFSEGAAVERHVLALPLSRELDRFETLRDALAIYRLAFGQARQRGSHQPPVAGAGTRAGPEAG